MKLFPQVEEWVLNELIDPNSNKVTNKIDFIYKLIIKECSLFNSYTFKELLADFNSFLICPDLEEENDEDYEVSYKNIKTVIFAGNKILKLSYLSDITTSYYDICALLLILKKIKEEELNIIENPKYFIENIDLDNFALTPDLGDCSVTDFLSYENILDDEFMIESYNFQDANNIEIYKLLERGCYSYLFLNEKYKTLTYEGFNKESVLQLGSHIINNLEFKKDLFKYNSESLSFIEEWFLDKDTVILAVTNNGLLLKFASEQFKSDREIVRIAVSNNGNSLMYASEDLKLDTEFVDIAFLKNPNS